MENSSRNRRNFHRRFLFVVAFAALLDGCARSPEQKLARFVEAGKKHMTQKNYERAMLEFRNAADIAPKDPEFQYQLGLAYFGMNDLGAATRFLRRAAELSPPHAGAQLKLAEILSLTTDPKLLTDAKYLALNALTLRPGDPDVLQVLAAVEWRLGNVGGATGHLMDALRISPQHLKSTLTLAGVHMSQKNFAEAERTLTAAAEKLPAAPEIPLALGRMYLAGAKPGLAETQLRRALEIDPQNGPALLELARLQHGSGKQQQAGQTLERLSKIPDKTYQTLHAVFLFQAGQQTAAISELEKMAKDDPGNRDVRSRLVEAYMASNRVADAEKLLTQALQKNRRDVAALEQHAQLLVNSGRLEQAEGELNELLQLRPESAQARYLLARTQRARGNLLAYRVELRRVLTLDPALLAARLELSESLRGGNAGKAALELLEHMPAGQKSQPAVIAERNWIFLSLEQYPEAARGIEQGLKLARGPALLLQDGLVKLHEKKFAAARASLEEALTAAPEDLRVLDALARTFFSEGRSGLALDRLRRHSAQLSHPAPVERLLGEWLERTGDPAGAKTVYRAASDAAPSFVPARVALARLEMQDRHWDQARVAIQGAVAVSPNHVDALLALGMLEDSTGNAAAAIGAYRKLLAVAPDHPVALNNLAVHLAEKEEGLDEGLALARKAKELVPDSAAVSDTIGWIYVKKGLYPAAVKYLENAAAGSNSARVKYHLAIAYFKAGNAKLGRAALEAAERLDPNLPEAAMARQAALSP